MTDPAVDQRIKDIKDDVNKQGDKLDRALTLVTEVATLQKQEALIRQEDRTEFKEMVSTVNKLALQVGTLEAIHGKLADHWKEISVNRHELGNLKNFIDGIAPKIEDLIKTNATQSVQIGELNKWHERVRLQEAEETGIRKTERKFGGWAVAGFTAAAGAIGWLFDRFF